MARTLPAAGGFALIEALASLVIVAMISLMMVEGVGTGRRVWERMDAHEAAADAVDSAQNALRGRLEQIFPADRYDADGPYLDFDGDAHTLIFLALPPQADRPAPLRRYELMLTAPGDLVLASAERAPSARGGGPSAQVLARGVRELDLAYFGAVAPDTPGQWSPRWRRRSLPPELVRVRVGFQPGDRRRWPDLIVAPRAMVDADCALSAITHDCQGRL